MSLFRDDLSFVGGREELCKNTDISSHKSLEKLFDGGLVYGGKEAILEVINLNLSYIGNLLFLCFNKNDLAV